ncbi:oligosaccharide flippase family protein [Caldifermentibacillus hisashii]|uniref:oligosaccharide flippase family protein n=1 Tax=Caldifermentibacillus hisashii TaxID=996558 RepID=UPI002DFE09C7|nr:oligosaccharide flippase family protein [Caldifermentibacillus hisashii]MEC5272001.1 oligosaccharide flippase family protein [Caldifermentibacillus hisashii]
MGNSQLKLGIYLSYISLFVTNITNLVLTPFIIRNLGQSEYGLYMLIGAFIGYLTVLDLGLGNATVRFIAKYRAENNKEKEENFLFITLLIYFIISVITLLVGIFLYFNLESIFKNSLSVEEIELAKVMFVILIINLALTLPMNSFTGVITAYEKFVYPRLITIIRTLVRAFIILTLLFMGYKSLAIVLVDALLNLVMLLANIFYVFFKLKVRVRLHNLSLALIKEIFSYSFLIFISALVDQLYWRIGHFILGIVASTVDVAIFAISMVFGQYFITFSTAISGVFLPKITKMIVQKSSDEELTNILIKTGRLQFLILGLVFGGFVLFGKKFIQLWAGPGYEESWLIAIIVMSPLIIVLTQTIGISILQAKNMHGFRAISLLCIALLNLIISFYLSKKYGALGAAIGTSLSLFLGNVVVMNLYYYFKVGINIPRFFRTVSKRLYSCFFIILILGSSLLFMEQNSWAILAVQCSVYVVLYIFIMWKFGLNSYEKKIFVNEFHKLGFSKMCK